MAVISYNDLLANALEPDLTMLTAFAFGQRVVSVDAAEADALFAQATRLNDAGLLVELHRVYEVKSDGSIVQSFDGLLVSEAKAYINQLSRERIALSRSPLP